MHMCTLLPKSIVGIPRIVVVDERPLNRGEINVDNPFRDSEQCEMETE